MNLVQDKKYINEGAMKLKKLTCYFLFLILIMSGCSSNDIDDRHKIRSVEIKLTNQNGLDKWDLSMEPRIDTAGQQVYNMELTYTGDSTITGVTVYHRVDSAEKLAGKIVKADSKTIFSTIEQHDKITLSDLTLPVQTPISIGLDWQDGNHIYKGSGVFVILEVQE